MLLLNQLRKKKDAIEDICMEHSHTDVGKTWTIGETERKRLKAFEMWCYRRMRNITNGWTELQMKKFLEESEKEEPCEIV